MNKTNIKGHPDNRMDINREETYHLGYPRYDFWWQRQTYADYDVLYEVCDDWKTNTQSYTGNQKIVEKGKDK